MNLISNATTTSDVFRVVNYALNHQTIKCFDLHGTAADVRDIRIRAQRALAELHDIELWEPETLTKHQIAQIIMLRALIAACKQYESTHVRVIH